jgi:hypothetical protein
MIRRLARALLRRFGVDVETQGRGGGATDPVATGGTALRERRSGGRRRTLGDASRCFRAA